MRKSFVQRPAPDGRPQGREREREVTCFNPPAPWLATVSIPLNSKNSSNHAALCF